MVLPFEKDGSSGKEECGFSIRVRQTAIVFETFWVIKASPPPLRCHGYRELVARGITWLSLDVGRNKKQTKENLTRTGEILFLHIKRNFYE
jgi:hypothetical protein